MLLPVAMWHDAVGDPTLADLDRLLENRQAGRAARRLYAQTSSGRPGAKAPREPQ